MPRRSATLADGRLQRCARCGQVKPRTPEHFYFSGGRVTGYCRPCHAAYWQEHYARGQIRRPPHYARDWRRRTDGIPPGRYRQRDTPSEEPMPGGARLEEGS